MKLSEIYQIADGLAPKALSDEMCEKYGWYDNSGVLVDVDEEIKGVVFALDLSDGAIDLALEKGANLILTHHPAIYGKISRVDYHDGALLGRKLVRCIRAGISVIAMHLNLDAAIGGIDECLMEGICLAAKQTKGAGMRSPQIQLALTGGGYGRAYDLSSTSLQALAAGIREVFSTTRVEVYGEADRQIARAASFCGAGADEKSVAFALQSGAQVMISSDFKHHVLALALESGLSVLTLTHYASENYGFKKYYEKIRGQLNLPCFYYEEGRLL